MKRIIAFVLAVVFCLGFVACGETRDSSKPKEKPYRGVTQGMTFDEVKELEEGFGSKYMEEDEERILFETQLEGDTVRIVYFFEDGKLAYYNICANPSFGTKDYLEFYSKLSKKLSRKYSKSKKDGETYWENKYETIRGTTNEDEFGVSSIFYVQFK